MRAKIVVIIVASLAVLVLLAWPREVVVSPLITVSIRDASHRPVAGVLMARSYAHYSVEGIAHHDDARTNAAGVAVLPVRKMRLSRAREWVSAVRNNLQNVDSGFGVRSWVIVDLPESGRDGVTLAPAASDGERVAWACVVGRGCARGE